MIFHGTLRWWPPPSPWYSGGSAVGFTPHFSEVGWVGKIPWPKPRDGPLPCSRRRALPGRASGDKVKILPPRSGIRKGGSADPPDRGWTTCRNIPHGAALWPIPGGAGPSSSPPALPEGSRQRVVPSIPSGAGENSLARHFSGSPTDDREFPRWLPFQGRASSTRLKGVSAARWTSVKPPCLTISHILASPAWAPRAGPCPSREQGTQIMVEAA
jgi:hypothetical protein